MKNIKIFTLVLFFILSLSLRADDNQQTDPSYDIQKKKEQEKAEIIKKGKMYYDQMMNIERKVSYINRNTKNESENLKRLEKKVAQAKIDIENLKIKLKKSITRYFYYANDAGKVKPKLYTTKPDNDPSKGEVKFIDQPDPAIEKALEAMKDSLKKSKESLKKIRFKVKQFKNERLELINAKKDFQNKFNNLNKKDNEK